MPRVNKNEKTDKSSLHRVCPKICAKKKEKRIRETPPVAKNGRSNESML